VNAATVDLNKVGGNTDGHGTRLAGLVALVTGAGGDDTIVGAGAATARLFAAQGAFVGVLDSSRDRVDHTLRCISSDGGQAVGLVADVGDESQVQRAVDELSGAHDRLDIVVNNAAVTGRAAPAHTSWLESWNATLRVNLTGTMLVSRMARPYLVNSSSASIVNVSSVAANRGLGSESYGASKGGIQALTLNLAFSWGLDGIRVNCVAPGHMYSTMSSTMPLSVRESRRRATLLNREGGGWDVAWSALFLASPEARWLTGVVLPVDGGASATTAIALERRDRAR
jgi:NAD(P)-dependent dehydrogenase (short-subunit alcohol dehydrogenase family)